MQTNWGIKSRILTLTIFPTMIVTFALAGYFIFTATQEQRLSLEKRAQAITQQLALASEFAVSSNNTELLQNLISITKKSEPNIIDIMIFNHKQQPMFPSSVDDFVRLHHWPHNSLPDSARIIYSANSITTYFPVINIASLTINGKNQKISSSSEGKTILGYVALEMDQSNIQLSSFEVLFTSALIFLGSLTLAIFFAGRMAKSVTAPIINMADTVNHIKQGNLEARVESQAIQELNELSLGINSMADSLQKGRDEFQLNLDKSTSSLTQTLEKIEIQNVELDIAKKQAQELSRIKSEFLANVSHEIRTPMNGVIGFCNLLMKTKLNEKQTDYLQTIKNSSRGLLAIIDDILDFSKIEAGKMQLEKNAVDLREELDEVLTMLGPIAANKDLELVGLVYKDIPDSIMGDSVRIKQVLTNLINNAIKFTDSGSIIVRVMLEEYSLPEVQIKVVVSDTGPGLTEQQQKKLFQSFSQADTSTTRKYGGTGLGLAICKKLVTNMGGEIGIDSSHGNGADFWFTLKAQVSQTEKTYQPPLNWRERDLYLLEPHKILCISLKHIFTEWGFKVHSFNKIDSLIETLSSIKIDPKKVGNDKPPLIISSIQRNNDTFDKLNDWLIQHPQLEARTIILSRNIVLKDQDLLHNNIIAQVINKPAPRKKLFHTIESIFPRIHSVSNNREDLTKIIEQSHLKILVVDDNPENLKLITEILMDKKIKPDTASDGQQAVVLSRKQKYDLILMDIQMPKLDGLESTSIIRINSLNISTPIIAVTAHALKGEKESLINAGMDGYLSKPIDEDDLQETINHWCFKQPLLEKRFEHPNVEKNAKPLSNKIDWPSCLKLANGKQDLAEEFLSKIVKSIPLLIQQSQTFLENKQLEELIKVVHKFHGGICYSGLPALKKTTLDLESKLKKYGLSKISKTFDLFIKELQLTEKEYQQFSVENV